ncbi:MAG: DUF4410 domain-containing protein [Myxococcota bacterium]
MFHAKPRPAAFVAAALCGLLLGCASTKVSDQHAYEGGVLPKPARIIVHDFAATPEDIPEWAQAHSAYAGAGAQMDEKDLEAGRKLGQDVAKELVHDINETGMIAVRAEGQPGPQLDDIVLVGYFTSVDEGSAAERVLIGFGKGAAKIGAHAEGYRMADSGLVLLGSGNLDAGGGKSPGLVVPTVVTIATHNPIGLVVSGAVKAAGEATGRSGAKGDAHHIADAISKVLKSQFEKQGWI